jgi:hypothetical protein
MDIWCVYAFILCLGSGLATGLSLVQRSPTVCERNDYGTDTDAWALNGLEEPLKKKKKKGIYIYE